MELVRDNIINEVFRAIAMVFALVLGSCGEQTTTGVLPTPMSGSNLPVQFAAGEEQFIPSGLVQLQNGFDGNGQPMVTIALSAGDAEEFGNFTKRHVGQAVELRVCNDVLAAPIVQEAIYGGRIVVSGFEAWAAMAEYLANGCP